MLSRRELQNLVRPLLDPKEVEKLRWEEDRLQDLPSLDDTVGLDRETLVPMWWQDSPEEFWGWLHHHLPWGLRLGDLDAPRSVPLLEVVNTLRRMHAAVIYKEPTTPA